MDEIDKWHEEFLKKLGEKKTADILAKDIQDAWDVEKAQEEADINISKICKKRWK